MNFTNQLNTLIEKYIENIKNDKFQNLRIIIPDFNGTFLIMTDKQLMLHSESSKDDELCLLFSFKPHSKKNKSLLSKIQETNCLLEFKFLESDENIAFIKKTENNSTLIMETVNMVLNTLFPTINLDLITIELNEISGWQRLDGK